MKTKIFLTALVVIALLFSCKKDSGPAKNTHRIMQVITDYNKGTDHKSVLTYDDKERLIMIMGHEKEEGKSWKEVLKMEISYNPEEISLCKYTNESGSWEYDSKEVYYVEGELLEEEWYYYYRDGDWVELWKWTYQYSGTNIIKWQEYYYNKNDENFEPGSKGEYDYINNKLDEYKGYYYNEDDGWIQWDREEFFYSGNNLSAYIDYNLDKYDDWIESYKCEYIYYGDKLTEAEYYDWEREDNDWEYEPFTVTYGYNINGYLIEIMDDDGDKTTYEYEAGHGNAAFFWYYPENLVYGKPTLKSTAVRKKYTPYYERLLKGDSFLLNKKGQIPF